MPIPKFGITFFDSIKVENIFMLFIDIDHKYVDFNISCRFGDAFHGHFSRYGSAEKKEIGDTFSWELASENCSIRAAA